MEGSPKFSIAVPAFKKSFIKECIDSVLSQTYPDFELIIVDDASPEDLDSVICTYSDPRIIHRKNAVGFGAYNVSKNWDECLKYASGEYFMCIGDDDKLLPDCLEKYVSLIESFPDFPIYHAGTQMIDANSKIISLQEKRPLVESAYSMIWHRWFSSRKTYIGDYLFRTSVLRQMGGFIWFPFAWGSDEQSVYYAASLGKIANMQSFGFQYRVNNQTITFSRDHYKGKTEAHRLAKQWYGPFLEKEPQDPDDRLYWKFIKDGLDEHFRQLYMQNIKDDICFNSLKNIRHWIRTRSDYELSMKDILKCYLFAVRKRMKD